MPGEIKLTPQQVENWRTLLGLSLFPFSHMVSDDAIEEFANDFAEAAMARYRTTQAKYALYFRGKNRLILIVGGLTESKARNKASGITGVEVVRYRGENAPPFINYTEYTTEE